MTIPGDQLVLTPSQGTAPRPTERQIRGNNIRENLHKISKKHHRPLVEDLAKLQKVVIDAANQVPLLETELEKRRSARSILSKSGLALQKFTSTFAQFLEVYSGIVDISKGADAHYGGLICGALSLLLVIGRNKNGRETAINASFDELAKSWIGEVGRLKFYALAYHESQKMDDLIEDVYLGIGELAVESQKYYLRPPYRRFLEAIWRPPKLGIDTKVETIKKAILEVVAEGNARLVHGNAQLVEQLEKSRNQKRHDRYVSVAGRLGIDLETAGQDKIAEKCKTLHTDAFTKATRRGGRTKLLQQISIDLLKDLNFYEPWNDKKEPSLLVLSGTNFDDYETGRHLCWLSPLATQLAEMQERRQATERVRTAFFSGCQDNQSRFAKLRDKTPLSYCLSHIIWQILHWDNEYFEQHHEEVKTCLEKNSWIENPLSQRKALLRSLFRSCSCFDEVFIIIDRLDCIAESDEDTLNELGTLLDDDVVGTTLETLLELVGDAACVVKLIVTVNASGWLMVQTDADMETRWKVWKQQQGLKHWSMYHKIGWQQPEATIL